MKKFIGSIFLLAAITGHAATLTFTNLAQALASSPGSASRGTIFETLGRNAIGDGGGHKYYLDTVSSATNLAERAVTGGVLRMYQWAGDPRPFGAIPNDAVDDTAAIQAALNHAYNLGEATTNPSPAVVFPAGTYLLTTVTTRVSMLAAGRHALGYQDTWAAELKRLPSATNDLIIFDSDGADRGFIFEGFKVTGNLNSGPRNPVDLVSVTSRTNFTVNPADMPNFSAFNPRFWAPFYGWCGFWNNDGYYIGAGMVKTVNTNTGAVELEWQTDNYATRSGAGFLLEPGFAKVGFGDMDTIDDAVFGVQTGGNEARAGYSGLVLRGARRSMIRNCRFQEWWGGITLIGGDTLTIEDCEFQQCHLYAIGNPAPFGWSMSTDHRINRILVVGDWYDQSDETDTWVDKSYRCTLAGLYGGWAQGYIGKYVAGPCVYGSIISSGAINMHIQNFVAEGPFKEAFWMPVTTTSTTITNMPIGIDRLQVNARGDWELPSTRGSRDLIRVDSGQKQQHISIGKVFLTNFRTNFGGWYWNHLYNLPTVVGTNAVKPTLSIGEWNDYSGRITNGTTANYNNHASVTPVVTLDLLNPTRTLMLGGTATEGKEDDTIKTVRVLGYGYDTDLPWTILNSSASSGGNALNWGGGTVLYPASSQQNWYIGVGVTNLAGTWVARLDSTSWRHYRPVEFHSSGPLEIYNGLIGLRIGADSSGTNRTDATTKDARIGMPHYLNAEENLALISGTASASGNLVNIGGGSSLLNAATTIRFYIGTNFTNATGTLIAQFANPSAADFAPLSLYDPSVVSNRLGKYTTDSSRTLYFGDTPPVFGGGGDTNFLFLVEGTSVDDPNLIAAGGDVAPSTASVTNVLLTIKTNTVTSAKIVDGTIVAADLAAQSVPTNKLLVSGPQRVIGRTLSGAGVAQELEEGVGVAVTNQKVQLRVAAGSNVTLSTNGNLLTISSTASSGGDTNLIALPFHLTSAVQATNTQDSVEVPHYAWTIPAGTLSTNGDELEFTIPGYISTLGSGPDGLTWNFNWDDASQLILTYSTSTNKLPDGAGSASALFWKFNVRRLTTNTMSIHSWFTIAPEGSSPGVDSTNKIEISSGYADFPLTASSWDVDDLTFSLSTIQTNINAGGKDIWTSGYTVLKHGSVSGSTAEVGELTVDTMTLPFASANVTVNASSNLVAATGTHTSTNFLAGDGAMKQVTTNMIPGLVADMAAKAPLASPALTGPTITWPQAALTAHSATTNFVADLSLLNYQLITATTNVNFIHATNVAAGRWTTILVLASGGARTVTLPATIWLRNTNTVAVADGGMVALSVYGYGANNTNVIATIGEAAWTRN